jgi:hypothetical protein
MKDTTYNGWANYATWRVHLELIDGLTPDDFGLPESQQTDDYELSICVKNAVHDQIDDSAPDGLARDYALAFLQDVNWHQIAKHMIAYYAEEETEETTDQKGTRHHE